jgi:peptidoglycan/xylan/chitin deacetylase (PgdA/CDA1 family)
MSKPSPEPLVLMYHGLDPGDARYASADPSELAYILPAETFRYHLRLLRKSPSLALHSWGGSDLDSFSLSLRERGRGEGDLREPISNQLPTQSPVLLTFDDGMASDYDTAFPLLRDQNCNALFFITTALVGAPGRVTWGQLREMAHSGMLFGTHGHTHRFLSTLSPSNQRDELDRSRKLLEDQTGAPVLSLSLPGGRYNRHTLDLAAECGYRALFTSIPARIARDPQTNLLLIGRIPVRRTWTPAFMEEFLSRPQRHIARMRRAHTLRALAQSGLGAPLYSRLHRLIWKAMKNR